MCSNDSRVVLPVQKIGFEPRTVEEHLYAIFFWGGMVISQALADIVNPGKFECRPSADPCRMIPSIEPEQIAMLSGIGKDKIVRNLRTAQMERLSHFVTRACRRYDLAHPAEKAVNGKTGFVEWFEKRGTAIRFSDLLFERVEIVDLWPKH